MKNGILKNLILPIIKCIHDKLKLSKNDHFQIKMDAETLAKQLEMEAMADMFTKMTDSCHNKCISKYYDRKIIIVILLSNRKMLSKQSKNIRLFISRVHQRIFVIDFSSPICHTCSKSSKLG